jgi:hypothetical protein
LNGLNDLNGFFLLLLIVMRKAFKDADFHRDYKKLTGEDLDSLMPEEMEKAISEMPRDAA